MGQALGWFIGILFFIYLVGGWWYTRVWFARRHGVGFDKHDTGAYAAAFVSVMWPVAIFVPSIKYPQLCTHSHHVLARQQAEQEADSVSEQLDREREVGL